jgi:hypothetical protein
MYKELGLVDSLEAIVKTVGQGKGGCHTFLLLLSFSHKRMHVASAVNFLWAWRVKRARHSKLCGKRPWPINGLALNPTLRHLNQPDFSLHLTCPCFSCGATHPTIFDACLQLKKIPILPPFFS